jgi:hypothetical protein
MIRPAEVAWRVTGAVAGVSTTFVPFAGINTALGMSAFVLASCGILAAVMTARHAMGLPQNFWLWLARFLAAFGLIVSALAIVGPAVGLGTGAMIAGIGLAPVIGPLFALGLFPAANGPAIALFATSLLLLGSFLLVGPWAFAPVGLAWCWVAVSRISR